MRLIALLVLAAGLLLATAAPAQAPGAGGEGPAIMVVSAPGSTVFVIGVPGSLPKGLTWRSTALEGHLKGASALLLPPEAKGGPAAFLKFIVQTRATFQSKTPMEDTLSPPLRARFVAARKIVGKDAARYAKWKPGLAGMMLLGDFREAEKLALGEPEKRIRALARAAKARERRVGAYEIGPMLTSLSGITDETHRLCLSDTLSQVEGGHARLQAASRGWARGDIAAAMAAEDDFDRCLAQIPALTALNEQSMREATAAIAAAVAKPGKTVAVVDLRQLMMRGGVLDRLRARGLKVERAP